jgi:transglutaminase-like putative cysteine protease
MRVRILSRTTGGASADGPSRTLFYWLISAFLLTLLPHVTQLPAWLTGSILAATIVRCLAEWRRWPLPTTTSTGVVALCLLSAIFLQYHTVLGRDAGTPFMAGLLTIKFYELRGPRDVTLIIFSSFFVVMSALLFSQAIELFVYCLIMMWLLTGILLRTYMGDHGDHDLLKMLRTSSVIFLQALPLALLIFFFLPRYSGRFEIPLTETTTGISERVAPGSIAELAQDDSPAMRVTFQDDSIPLPSSMYWRAIVLWHFDQGIWTRGDGAERPEEQQPVPAKDSGFIQQQIVLWPSNQRWIPALDRPTALAQDSDSDNPSSRALIGDVLVTRENQVVDSKRHYTVRSSPIAVDSSIDSERGAALQLPPINPQVQRLADDLHAANPQTSAYVRAVLHYFQSQHFRLSTDPGRLGPDPVAEFLFQTKVGFCEHYASAFAVLMRAAHVPARMVVGYRGGEYNSYGGFYLVSQSNAHAWDEIWSDERHEWMRVDPTTVISAGSNDALAANEGLYAADDGLSIQVANRRFTFLSGDSLPGWLRHGLRDLAMHREEMEAQWDDWVFSYEPDTQDRLAQSLGFGHQGWLVLLAVCLGIMGTGGALTAYFLSRQEPLSPVEEFYAQFCRRMAQRGAPRDAWEGPLAYTERLAAWFPEQREPIEQTGWIVAEQRYAPGENKPTRDLRELLAATSGKS